MKQIGKFYIYAIEDDIRKIEPIPNAKLYFANTNDFSKWELVAQVDGEGNFNFDLPLGEYRVVATLGDGIEQILANGSTFILTDQSEQNAFEQWINEPAPDTDSALLEKFRELMLRTEDAAAIGIQAGIEVNENLDANLQKLSDRTDLGLTALTVEKNSSIKEIKDTKDQSLTELKTATDKAEGIKQDINNARDSGVATINDTKTEAVKKVEETKVSAISEVEGAIPDFTADLAKKQDALEFIGEGKVMKEGAYNLGVSSPASNGEFTNLEPSSGFYSYNNPSGIPNGIIQWGSYIVIKYSRATMQKVVFPNYSSAPMHIIRNNAKGWEPPITIYGTSNTTVDSNGFIKAASPIIKLFKDRIEHSGFGDNEPIFEKLGVGQYKISNTLGLAQEGWTYEKPRGSDGQPYFRIVVEKLEDGCIVRVHDEYDTVEKAEITDINGNTRTVDKIVKILGQARDIKEHERWIDLRFHEEPEEHQDEELLTEHDESKESY